MSRRVAPEWSWALLAGPVAVLAGALGAAAAEPETLKLEKKIELKGKPGKLDHLTVDSKGQRLFLANKVNNTFDVVDLKAGKLLRQLPGQAGAQGVAYAPDLDRVFVALGTGGYCNIFDGKDYKLLKTVKFMDDADNVRYDPRSHLVYVAHAEKALGVIDGKTFDLKADISLPGPAEGFQLATGRPRLFLCMPSPSEVAVIDTDKNEVVNRYPLKMAGGGHPLGLDEANHRIFVGCRKKPMVVVLDSDSGKEITGIDIPGDIDDLFYDAKRKRIYASCGEGFLAVIRQNGPDKYEMLEKVPTVKDARTSFYDPATGKLYLGVPRQRGKQGPEIWVYQTR
jgi:DNA-binding beta-propeller fold protein YncE